MDRTARLPVILCFLMLATMLTGNVHAQADTLSEPGECIQLDKLLLQLDQFRPDALNRGELATLATQALELCSEMDEAVRRDAELRVFAALNRELQPASLLQEADDVTSLDWSPDGKLLAAACDDGLLRIYSRKQGFKLTDRLVGHDRELTEVAFSPDGSLLASGSFDGTAIIRSVEPGFPVRHRIELDGDLLHRTLWSPDGRYIALTSRSGLMRILETGDFSSLCDRLLAGGSSYSLSWSPDGAWICAGGKDGLIQVWNARENFREQQLEQLPTSTITGTAWSPESAVMVSVDADGCATSWDSIQGFAMLDRVDGHSDAVFALAWNPTGSEFCTFGWDGKLKRWQNNGNYWSVWREHDYSCSFMLALQYSPDGSRLAFGSSEGELGLLDVADADGGTMIRTVPILEPKQIAWSTDSRQLATTDGVGALYILDFAGPLTLRKSGNIEIADGGISSATLESLTIANNLLRLQAADPMDMDGRELAELCRRVLLGSSELPEAEAELARLRVLAALLQNAQDRDLGLRIANPDVNIPQELASPDGRWLARADGIDTVRLLDCSANYAEAATFEWGTVYPAGLQWSPDSRWLATASQDGSLRISDAADGFKEAYTLRGHQGRLELYRFSPDGRFLLTSGEDYTLLIRDVADGFSERLRLGPLDVLPDTIDWSPEGDLIATLDGDGWLTVFNSGDAQRIYSADFSKGSPNQFCWSPDSRWLLLSSAEDAISMLDARHGFSEEFRLQAGDEINGPRFSADGKLLAAETAYGLACWRISAEPELLSVLRLDHSSSRLPFCFSPSGKYLLVDNDQGELLLLDPQHALNEVLRLPSVPDGAVELGWSSGRILVNGLMFEHLLLECSLDSLLLACDQLQSELSGPSDENPAGLP
ncbi:hypothetical protein KDL29_05650 [bacterium]|nr:hypothetical protein [bacterium]